MISEWPSHAAGDRRLRKVKVWQGEERGGDRGEERRGDVKNSKVCGGWVSSGRCSRLVRCKSWSRAVEGSVQTPDRGRTSASSNVNVKSISSKVGLQRLWQVRRQLAQVTREEEQCRSRRRQGQRGGRTLQESGRQELRSKQASRALAQALCSPPLLAAPGSRPWAVACSDMLHTRQRGHYRV